MDSDSTTPKPRLHVTPDEARRVPVQPGHLSGLLATHGSVELRWYQPREQDPQTPHDRDEIYMIATGTGVFMRSSVRTPFSDDHELDLAEEQRVTVQAGDVLLVPAGTPHRFEAMSADFGTWMLFYGPEGGEVT